MKRFAYLLLTSLLASAALPAAAQSEGYDLAMGWGVTSPASSPKTEQPVTFSVFNKGREVDGGFKVGIFKNDQFLFEEQVDSVIPAEGKKEITLKQKVHLDYKEKAEFKLYVSCPGDTDRSNDTARVSVTMPALMDYPYIWAERDHASDFQAGEFGFGWSYNQENDAFVISGKSTNWMGSLGTGAINFPEDRLVRCTFDHENDKSVKLTVKANYGDSTVTVCDDVLPPSSTDFQHHQFSFVSHGPAILSIGAALQGEWYEYGTFVIKNISFSDAVKDIATVKILSPQLKRVAREDGGLTVKARFSNPSPFDVVNPVFSYKDGDDEVEEAYNGTLHAGETIDYTFVNKLSTPAGKDSISLTVWCHTGNDGETSNDTIATGFRLYDAQPFPYKTNFTEGNDNWDIVDANADGNTWTFVTEQSTGGAAVLPMVYYVNMDDYLIAPAVKVPAGKSRLSFYYAGQTRAATEHLTVTMGTSPSLEEMTDTILDRNITNAGWLNAYKLIDLKEPQTLYVAFHATGLNDMIAIGKVRIDNEADLCINNATFDTGSGYGKTTSKVTVSYMNHGVEPVKDVKLRYYLNNSATPCAEETSTQTVAPGDTAYYTFTKPADISVPDSSYTLIGEIATVLGEDQQNDKITGQTITNWASCKLPYFADFSDASRNVRWKIDNSESNAALGWSIQDTYQYYSPTKVLEHDGSVADGQEDWAFSEAVNLPKGRSELSFFYRTRVYFDSDDMKQSFAVKMGKEPSRQGMTMSVADFKDITVAGSQWKKFTCSVDVDEPGNYYLGFCNTSKGQSGSTSIDDVTIKPVAKGLALPYDATVSELDSQWTKENNRKGYSDVWWKASDDGTSLMLERTADDVDMALATEGDLVSPKLSIEAGRKIDITVDYALSSDSTNTRLCLYGGHIDNPDSLRLLDSLPQVAGDAFATVSYTFTPQPADTCLYLDLRVNSPKYVAECDGYVYKVRLRSVKVDYASSDGIADVKHAAAGVTIRRKDNSLTVSSDAPVSDVAVYDLYGRKVTDVSTGQHELTLDCSGLKGIYIVKVKTSDGERTEKIRF